MRYSRQHKDETHNRLLKKAAEEFRRRGVQGTGIASLMRQLGLTHGGFYAHFDSKNELVAQATGPDVRGRSCGWMLAAAEAAPKGKGVHFAPVPVDAPFHRLGQRGSGSLPWIDA